jgi:hypothetical protein
LALRVAGVVAVMLAFRDVAALSVVVAQFVVNGAMFMSFQAPPGGWPLPVWKPWWRVLSERRHGSGVAVAKTIVAWFLNPQCVNQRKPNERL